MKKLLVCILLTAAWIILIFGFSLCSALGSHMQSMEVKNVLAPIAHRLTALTNLIHYKDVMPSELFIRKLAHFLEYFVFGIIVSLLLSRISNSKRRFILIFIIGPYIAFCDEYIVQFFHASGRTPSFFDVIIDCTGYFAAVALFALFHKLRRFVRSRKAQKT